MMLAIMFLAQFLLALIVIGVLWNLLEKELFQVAMERMIQLRAEDGRNIEEVTLLTARRLAADRETRLTGVIREKFPLARVMVVVSPEILGGVVVQAGSRLIDSSLMSKIKQFRSGETA